MPKIIDKAQVVEDENGQWHVKLLSDNEKTILTSEQYQGKEHALDVANDLGVPVEVKERK